MDFPRQPARTIDRPKQKYHSLAPLINAGGKGPVVIDTRSAGAVPPAL